MKSLQTQRLFMRAKIAVLLLLFPLAIFAADFKTEELLGRWRFTVPGEKKHVDIVFANEGKYSGAGFAEGKEIWKFAGNWSFDGRFVRYEYTASSMARVPVGTKDRDEVVELTKTYVVFKAVGTDGQQRKYIRVE